VKLRSFKYGLRHKGEEYGLDRIKEKLKKKKKEAFNGGVW